MNAILQAALWIALIRFYVGVGHGAPAAAPPYPKTNLMTFLAEWKPFAEKMPSVCELDPQWVGTVKRLFLRDPNGMWKEEPPEHIRFSHLNVQEDREGQTNVRILCGRVTARGTLGSSSEAPQFMSNLPSAKTVSEAKNLDDLRKMLGLQHASTSVWDDGKRMHWAERWTRFTTEGRDQLRYLSVFAHVSSADREKPADIDILRVSEGLFRPANPKSAEERAQFKVGEIINAEYEEGRASARAQYPFPLRSLVEARQMPDDSDLFAYKRALNEVRKNPPPELFGQFAEWIHQGTVEIQGMLENVLFDGFLKLEKWEEPQRRIALKALTDALPRVKTGRDLDKLVSLLLQAQGGGHLRMPVSGTAGVIDIKAERRADGGSSVTFGSRNVEDLVRAAEECQKALRKRYPNLE
jgi:hypothetical protein